ncbi:MAG: NAD(P)H-dependent oxidoreductase subunit E, partial [Kiritimatiellae bacterium]|nr:NAD(P)H-dependent oxidoreductase subunit E [Kiritimatiellia bacterium]
MAIQTYLLVCNGEGCTARHGTDVYEAIKRELGDQGVSAKAQVVRTGCLGHCSQGPVVKVLPGDIVYGGVTPADARELVAEQVVKGQPLTRLLLDTTSHTRNIRLEGVADHRKQFRVVLRNCGVIDPEKIDDYLARDGYAALAKMLTEMTPDQVIATLKKSGLRGRGGAGFPTWMKWKFTKDAVSEQKYVVCNADEGDP